MLLCLCCVAVLAAAVSQDLNFLQSIPDNACKSMVHEYQKLAAQDIRFDVPLADACIDDRLKYCANVQPVRELLQHVSCWLLSHPLSASSAHVRAAAHNTASAIDCPSMCVIIKPSAHLTHACSIAAIILGCLCCCRALRV